MGSLGKNKIVVSGGNSAIQNQEEENQYVNTPTEGLEGVTTFEGSSQSATDKWFANPKLSNYTNWTQNLTAQEKDGIDYYTGSGYSGLNKALYETPWDEMSPYHKKQATAFYDAINKFELNKAIQVSRGTSLSYIGGASNADELKAFLSQTDGVVQFNGFQSASTGPHPAFGGSLIIHYTIPPSKGAGAYVRPISMHPGEGEFTINNNAVVKFDLDSITKKGGSVHINATWLGQAADQVFNKKG